MDHGSRIGNLILPFTDTVRTGWFGGETIGLYSEGTRLKILAVLQNVLSSFVFPQLSSVLS
jgi:hypothetical protein